MATLTPIIARATKLTTDGRGALSFTDADWRDAAGAAVTPAAGDQVIAFLYSRVSPVQIVTTVSSGTANWTPLKPGTTPEVPVAGTLGTTFLDADALAQTSGLGLTGRYFLLFQNYAVGRTLSFSATGTTSGAGGFFEVVLLVVRDAATQPIASMKTPTFSYSTSLAALAPAGESGYPLEAAAARIAWAGPPSNTIPVTVGVGASYSWTDNGYGVPVTVVGDVRGGRKTTSAVMVTACGTADDFGALPFGNPSFSPAMVGGGVLTLVFAAKVPLNFLGAPPAIVGTFQGGQTIAADPGKWSGQATITYTYQFFKRTGGTGTGTSMGAASGTTTKLLAEGDVGYEIRVAIVATTASGSATAYSAWNGPVITGTSATPTGKPGITGNSHAGYGITNEALTINRANAGYSWTGSPTLTVEWGRALDATMAGAVVIATSDTYAVTSLSDGRYLAVREKASTGVTSAWSDALKATRPVSEASDLVIRKPLISVGALVKGDVIVGTESTFSYLSTTFAASSNYVDYAYELLCNDHPELSFTADVSIVQNTTNTSTVLDLAKATAASVTTLAPTTVPPIVGSWGQPTSGAPLTVTVPAAGFIAIAFRRTTTQGIGRGTDRFIYTAAVQVTQP